MEKTIAVTKFNWGYQALVASFTSNKTYVIKAVRCVPYPVTLSDLRYECNCENYKYQKNKFLGCKHIDKLKSYLTSEENILEHDDIPF